MNQHNNNKNGKKIIILLLLVIVVQPLFSQSLFSQTLEYKEKIELDEILEVKKLFLFASKYFVLSGNSIYSFSKKGQVINTISKKGEGPGEFYRITDFIITNSGRLIIGGLRTANSGKISVYEINGKLIKDYKIDFTVNKV